MGGIRQGEVEGMKWGGVGVRRSRKKGEGPGLSGVQWERMGVRKKKWEGVG